MIDKTELKSIDFLRRISTFFFFLGKWKNTLKLQVAFTKWTYDKNKIKA